MDTKQFEVTRTDEEWRRLLSTEQFAVMRRHGTERPGSCALNHEKRPGSFSCAGCGQELFVSKTKFESGTGWPSFFQPIDGAVTLHEDDSEGVHRVEVRSASTGIHLGHVFDDGPPPTGKRYCINSDVLRFVPDDGNKD